MELSRSRPPPLRILSSIPYSMLMPTLVFGAIARLLKYEVVPAPSVAGP